MLATAPSIDRLSLVPSTDHEILWALLRARPELVPGLLREALSVDVPAYTELRVESAELTEVVPTEYRADLMVLLVNGVPVLAIVVEVRLARKERKRFTGPLYAACVRARYECEAVVLVVTSESAVADWASRPILLGPGNVFRPFVLGPEAVPVVVDPARATEEPELAVLSVMAHGEGDVDRTVAIALAAAAGAEAIPDSERRVRCYDLVETGLSDAARKAFERLPKGYEFRSETVRTSIEKGRLEGRLEGRAEGRLDGQAEALAQGILRVILARGLSISEDRKRQILSRTEVEQLGRWLERAATAPSSEELFE